MYSLRVQSHFLLSGLCTGCPVLNPGSSIPCLATPHFQLSLGQPILLLASPLESAKPHNGLASSGCYAFSLEFHLAFWVSFSLCSSFPTVTFNMEWHSGLYHCLATIPSLPDGKDSTALFPSRPHAARANPNQEKTLQKEGRRITEQRNRVLSRHFSFIVAHLLSRHQPGHCPTGRLLRSPRVLCQCNRLCPPSSKRLRLGKLRFARRGQ